MRCPYLLLLLLPAVIHGTCVVEVRGCDLPFILDESLYVPDIVPCIPDSASPEPDFESSGEYLRYVDHVEHYCNVSLGASYVTGVCDYGCFDSESNMPLSFGDGSNNFLMFCKTKASACQFPFIWEGKEYTSCTKDGSDFYWCPVSLNQDKTIRGNRRGKCDMKTCTGDQNVVEQTDEEPEGDADCSCSNLISSSGGAGQCKRTSAFGGAVWCYVNKPSSCSDIIASILHPGEGYSAEACEDVKEDIDDLELNVKIDGIHGIHGTCVVEVRDCEFPFTLDENLVYWCEPEWLLPFSEEPGFASYEYLPYLDRVEHYCNVSLGASFVQGVCDSGCFDSEYNMPLSFSDEFNNLAMFCKTKASSCQFPFIWEGKEYTSCTKEGSDFYWCPVSLNQDKTIKGNRWGKCDMKTCTADQNVAKQTDEQPEGDDGPTLIHTDNNFKYYKVPVPESSKMTSATILNACTNHGMKPQCPGIGDNNDNEWPNSDTNCIRVKDCEKIDGCARVLSNVLCSTSDPRKCPTTLNMFWPMHKWIHGSACGVTTERYCGLNKDYTSTSNKPYFAACIDTIKPKEDMDDLELNVNIDDHDAKIDDIDVKIDQGAKIDDIEKHFNARMDKLEKAMNDQGAKIDGLEKRLDDVIDWIG